MLSMWCELHVKGFVDMTSILQQKKVFRSNEREYCSRSIKFFNRANNVHFAKPSFLQNGYL